MTGRPGPHRQHLLLTPEDPGARTRRRRLHGQLGALGWERLPAVFMAPASGGNGRWRGLRVSEQLDYGMQVEAGTPQGKRALTLRTADAGFTLVTGARLRKGGLDQLAYSLGYALGAGGRPQPDVLLAEGWARARTADFASFLQVVGDWFDEVHAHESDEEPSLRHLRCWATGLRAEAGR